MANLFVVYRPSLVPDIKQTLRTWSNEAQIMGVGELYIGYSQSFQLKEDPIKLGFDVAIDFQPDFYNTPLPYKGSIAERLLDKLNIKPSPFAVNRVIDYQEYVDKIKRLPRSLYKQFPCITPMWDNSRNARNLKMDFYKKKYVDGIFIQQESTYWRRGLWEKAGSRISTDYKYAGDFELWMRFFEFAVLFNTSALIGAFRVSGQGQISVKHYSDYLSECNDIIDSMTKKLSKADLRVLKGNGFLDSLIKVFRRPINQPGWVQFNSSEKRFYLAE